MILLSASKKEGGFPEGYRSRYAGRPERIWRARWGSNFPCLPLDSLKKMIATSFRSIQSFSIQKKEWGKWKSVFPPHALFAVVRLGYNGWPCMRRRDRFATHRCPLCSLEQGDSLDHIMRCGVVRIVFDRYKVCAAQHYQPGVFLFCDFRHSRGENL